MDIYRLDFTMHFASKGYADWVKAQADVRLTQAVVAINPEQINAENVSAEVSETAGGWVVRGMIAFRDGNGFNALAYCKDAFDTFATQQPWLLPDNEDRASHLSYHKCLHEQGGPCTIIEQI